MIQADPGIGDSPMTPTKARKLWSDLRRCVQASPDEALFAAFSRCEPLFDMLEMLTTRAAMEKGAHHAG